MPTVLVVDDEPTIRSTLSRLLTRFGCSVAEAGDGQSAAEAIAASPPDLVITDLEMPRGDGMTVLAAGQRAGIPVVVLTAHASLERAVDAMKRGAANFLAKPFTPEAVETLLQEAFGTVPRPARRAPSGRGPIGQEPTFRAVLDLADKVADTNATILVTGESGTGKEVIARYIHEASRRREQAFVPVNCGAIPEPLLESELFGHARGAFTGATQARRGRFLLADGGTLFLDEIGDMPLPLQVKLLRVLQDRAVEVLGESQAVKVDVRIVAATHRRLEERVRTGTFREDLYYRLNVVPLHLPPLRERPADVPLLVEHFIQEAAAQHDRKVGGITHSALAALSGYPWPGNVRELANIIERMVVIRGSGVLDVDDVPQVVRDQQVPRPEKDARDGKPPPVRFDLPEEGVDLADLMQRFEAQLIQAALERTGGNRSQAAALLRINRTTLLEKLKRYGDPSEK